MSLDGWSTRAKDEIYTFHTTTPKRRSFFTDGRILNGTSVTGEALVAIIKEILHKYQVQQYGAIVGDGGSNVRAAKIRISNEYPWIINIYDPCHNLNLFMKDLGKIFKEMLSIVSAIANYFGKSNYGTHHLNEQRKIDGIRSGIKSHSDTRFSSSYMQVKSVRECMPSIHTLVKKNILRFDTAATKKLKKYIDENIDPELPWTFMSEMSAFIRLLEPCANGLLTLEGSGVTCADVFYVWVCIAFQMEKVMTTMKARTSIISLFNARFDQVMKESSHDIFLVAYFLHPFFREHGGLQLNLPKLDDGQTLKPSQYPQLLFQINRAILSIFQGEQKREKDSGRELVPVLVKQILAYAYNEPPFNSPWKRGSNPRLWWEKVSKDSQATVISRVAIKVFSISPSEICDERTASRLGWLNAARRSSMLPEHLVHQGKLGQYYLNGLTNGSSTHHAHVHLSSIDSKVSTAQSNVTQAAPSLMDLVHAENIEPDLRDISLEVFEAHMFAHPDPYDLNETDRVDPALHITFPSSPTTVRSSTVFNIRQLVKLDDPNLVKMITNVDELGPGVESTTATEMKEGGQEMESEPGEWNVDDFLCD